MRVYSLVDNNPSHPELAMKHQHGLSMLINHDGFTVLFDTGADGTFESNAAKLGVDLSKVDAVVISHAHFDHAGGIERFIEVNDSAPIYIHESAKKEYLKKSLFETMDVGVNRKLFDKYKERFIFINQNTQISPNVIIYTDILELYEVESETSFYCRDAKKVARDTFDHEILLSWMIGDDRYVLFTGCNHRGVENSIATLIANVLGGRIECMFGGMHLENIPNGLIMTKSKVKSLATRLNKSCVNTFYTGHCTGHVGYMYLKNELKDRIKLFATGRIVDIE